MKLSLKKIITWAAIIICVIACAFIIITDSFGIEINIIKHHDTQLNGLTLKFYGDLKEIKLLKVYDGSTRRATLKISVDKAILEEAHTFQPYLDDLNGDGHLDLIVPHSKDDNQDFRYAAFLWDRNSSMFTDSGALNDIANISLNTDTGTITSTMLIRTLIAEEQPNLPEIYETRKVLTEYKMIDDYFVAYREVALTYYSETDIYCYSIYDYDPELEKLVYTDEQWISAEKAQNITLS